MGWRDFAWRAALTAAAVFVAIALLRAGIADVWYRGARLYFAGGPLSPEEIDVTLARLTPALAMDPQNPVILELLGDISYRQSILAADDPVAKRAHLEKARDLYAAAIASRPSIGERWADMIYVRSDLIKVRQELAAGPQAAARDIAEDLRALRQALEQATRLAPSRSAVLDAVEFAATAHEGLFGPEERRIVAAARGRAAETNRRPK